MERFKSSSLLISPLTSLNLGFFTQTMGTMVVFSLKVLLRNKWDDVCKDLRTLPGTLKCYCRYCCLCYVAIINASQGSLALAFPVYGTPLGQATPVEIVDVYEVSSV